MVKSRKRRQGQKCGTYEGKQKCIHNFNEGTLRKEATWNCWECDKIYVEDRGYDDVDWIRLAQKGTIGTLLCTG